VCPVSNRYAPPIKDRTGRYRTNRYEDNGQSGVDADAATGLATVDKTCRYLSAYPQVIKKLEAGESSALPRRQLVFRRTLINSASDGAKADRLGIFE
jgi:hypothetical protein